MKSEEFLPDSHLQPLRQQQILHSSLFILHLFRLDVIDRILGCSAPALDDDGEQGNDEAGKPGNSEYPGAERDAIGEVREPVAHDIK